ncbi:hypothetical protein B0H13DRAFT_1873817 [Mycena leptocephala]|nr:hypothetical protein B0H13DRAFT_1873817 [Mycena leptocephala]
MGTDPESEIVNTLLFLRYFTAFGLASIGYDHFLTLRQEFQVIWMNPKTGFASKAAFAMNRYLTESVIAYTVYVFSGTFELNDTVVLLTSMQLCGRFLWFFGSAAILFGAVIHSIVVLRIYALWDQRTNVARALTATFFICIVAITTIGVLCELQLQRKWLFANSTSLPLTLHQSFFDVLTIIITVYNALERPHRNHGDVITSLANDGFKFLLMIFCLRSMYLVSSLLGNPGQCFATVATCWSFTSIISARLHLRLDGLALKDAASADLRIPLSHNQAQRVMDSSWWDS